MCEWWEVLGSISAFVLLWALGLVVFPDVSCQNTLSDYITDRLGTSNYKFRLFTSNTTPGTATVIGDFTEATFAGYVAIAANTITWAAATLVGHVANSNGSNIVFNNTSGGAVNVYGVYVTNASGSLLYYAERDPAAPVSVPAGGSYIYTPNMQLKSIN
jgi:hypothetical protein